MSKNEKQAFLVTWQQPAEKHVIMVKAKDWEAAEDIAAAHLRKICRGDEGKAFEIKNVLPVPREAFKDQVYEV